MSTKGGSRYARSATQNAVILKIKDYIVSIDDTKQRLEKIAELEKKHSVLGCSVLAQGNVSTEEASKMVLNLLETLDDIQEGRVKYTCPDYRLLDELDK